MRFSSGQKLGNYEILEAIGVGGMGEVYRARDIELEREVAIKVLPEAFADDEERVARLEREARLLASLNHPHIAAIHSLEAVEGNRFLVLEVVEGETLQERIARGPLPLDEAIQVSRQIAEALEAAHGKGVIHRDLKPPNIKLAPEGGVKVLDFGLAKASAPAPSSSQSESPTFTRHTETGVILGTAPYMSPEQARGKPVDKRTDVWAFGCVLYEMLTGRNAFRGDDVSATLAQILEREPDWNALPARTPASVRRLLTRCLQKDPKRRLRDGGDAILELDAVETSREAPADTGETWWRRLVWSAVGLLVGVVVATWAGSRAPSGATDSSRLVRFHTEPISSNHVAPPFALSPDGSRLVYLGERDEKQSLYVRPLDRAQAEPLRGTEGASVPFISPDGASVGFFHADRGKLMTTSLERGSPVEVVDFDGLGRGASWGPDGGIVFPPDTARGLWRLETDGNTEELTHLHESKGEVSHRWPDLLPGGKGLLFALDYMTTDSWDDAAIAIASLDTGEHRILIEGGTSPRYVPTGHILFARDGSLLAVPFDLNRLEVTGAPVTVVDGIITNPLTGAAYFDVADDGTLATMRGGSQPNVRQLLWVDRGGEATPLPLEPFPVMRVDVSPDGTSLALDVESALADVWSYEIDRAVMTRLTFKGVNILLGLMEGKCSFLPTPGAVSCERTSMEVASRNKSSRILVGRRPGRPTVIPSPTLRQIRPRRTISGSCPRRTKAIPRYSSGHRSTSGHRDFLPMVAGSLIPRTRPVNRKSTWPRTLGPDAGGRSRPREAGSRFGLPMERSCSIATSPATG